MVYNGIVSTLIETTKLWDEYTYQHQLGVAHLASSVASEMGLPEDTVETVKTAGFIHDIGKLSVPKDILSKFEELTPQEENFVKIHPQTGYYFLESLGIPLAIAKIVYQHHERMDGSGYPLGLKNGQISPETHILIVADVVEAMLSHRPYRPALGMDAVVKELQQNKGILYDTRVVETCINFLRKTQTIIEKQFIQWQ